MDWSPHHTLRPDVSFDGGDLDCGNGLLLLIRRHIDPLEPGQLLEIRSTDASVEEDLPAWARLTGNALVSRTRTGNERSYLVRKRGTPASGTRQGAEYENQNAEYEQAQIRQSTEHEHAHTQQAHTQQAHTRHPDGCRSQLPPFAVMGIGSWPRPGWLLRALHDQLSGRLRDAEFQQYADDAVRLAVAAQVRADVDVVTDGEQRRDNYASFVGSRLENCQLIPVTDLLPYVEDPEHFAEELRSLDVPAEQVRHPAVFGRIRRTTPLTGEELPRLRNLTGRPVKVALPGPYLLTRTMWLECVSDRAYPDREELARDVVTALRQEAEYLLEAGATIVQFDEPVLTEVVFTRTQAGRSFMCGALGARRDTDAELDFAGRLIRAVMDGLPRDRLALHICRGNWSPDESVALAGPYTPLVPLLKTLPVGTFFLESATPRAGELKCLRDLPDECRVGVGVVNQKLDQVETVDEVLRRAEAAVELFGPRRVWLNPDCGFATFADNPVASALVAERKLAAVVTAAARLREKYGAE